MSVHSRGRSLRRQSIGVDGPRGVAAHIQSGASVALRCYWSNMLRAPANDVATATSLAIGKSSGLAVFSSPVASRCVEIAYVSNLYEGTMAERELALMKKLVEVGACTDIMAFLRDALELAIAVAGATSAYIELYDDSKRSSPPLLKLSHACYPKEEVDIHQTISTGVVAFTLDAGETVVTADASRDERFLKNASVRGKQAIICAPIGPPAMGVVYLQKVMQGPFSDDDVKLVEVTAGLLALLADRLLFKLREAQRTDATKDVRKRLKSDALIGRSRAVAFMLEEVDAVAETDVGVLLTGESGTGKTQLARVIHQSSARSNGPFIEINCANLAETLEVELFGAIGGRYTGVPKDVDGKIKAAEGGTVFLDEVTELKPQFQSKLLTFLESKTYCPMGGTTTVDANVRIIAATNVDPPTAVAEGKLRQDLYHRLNRFSIRVPSLAERREDIAELAVHLCQRVVERERLRHVRLGPRILSAFEHADWSENNVRQLENEVTVAALRANREGALVIELRHWARATSTGGTNSERPSYQEKKRAYEKRLIDEALKEAKENVSEAARVLDMSRQNLHLLIKQHWPDGR